MTETLSDDVLFEGATDLYRYAANDIAFAKAVALLLFELSKHTNDPLFSKVVQKGEAVALEWMEFAHGSDDPIA